MASPVEPGAIEMAQYFWYLNCSKASRELSFKPRDPGETLHDTVAYLARTSSAVTHSANNPQITQIKINLCNLDTFRELSAPLGVLAQALSFRQSGDTPMGRLRALLLLPFLICASLTANGQNPTPLQPNAPIDRTLGPNQIHEFTVTLEENAWIQFVVEQQGIDVVVKSFSPEGRALGEFDSPNGNDGPEHVSFVATTAGIYRITVNPLDPADTTSGRYQIKILEMRQATEQEIKASQESCRSSKQKASHCFWSSKKQLRRSSRRLRASMLKSSRPNSFGNRSKSAPRSI